MILQTCENLHDFTKSHEDLHDFYKIMKIFTSLQNHEEIIPVDENLACTREPGQGKNQNFRTQSLAKANKKT